jgi:hypothetical protein
VRLRKRRQSPSDEIRARSLARIDAMIAKAGFFSEATRPDPYTIDDFTRSFEEACLAGLKRDPSCPSPTVTLPEGVFPGVKDVLNPFTREWVPITRVSPFVFPEEP